MEKAEKKQRNLPKKPPAASLRIMPSSMAALFVAASIGRLSHLFPRWMSSKVEKEHDVTSSQQRGRARVTGWRSETLRAAPEVGATARR